MNRYKQETSRVRIAIINSDKCKPKKCNQQCKRRCPQNLTGKKCIEYDIL